MDYRSQGIAHIRVEKYDQQRSQQLDQFMANEMMSCRFSDIPAESGVRSFCGRVTSTALTTDGHQILCLSDGTRPAIKSHPPEGQKLLLPARGRKRRAASESEEETIQLRITDPVSSDQSVIADDIIVVLNAKFDHIPETGLTLITTNRNKTLGKAVSSRMRDTSGSIGSNYTQSLIMCMLVRES
jgi:hypothetical protein